MGPAFAGASHPARKPFARRGVLDHINQVSAVLTRKRKRFAMSETITISVSIASQRISVSLEAAAYIADCIEFGNDPASARWSHQVTAANEIAEMFRDAAREGAGLRFDHVRAIDGLPQR